jgi:hypothetical protein
VRGIVCKYFGADLKRRVDALCASTALTPPLRLPETCEGHAVKLNSLMRFQFDDLTEPRPNTALTLSRESQHFGAF